MSVLNPYLPSIMLRHRTYCRHLKWLTKTYLPQCPFVCFTKITWARSQNREKVLHVYNTSSGTGWLPWAYLREWEKTNPGGKDLEERLWRPMKYNAMNKKVQWIYEIWHNMTHVEIYGMMFHGVIMKTTWLSITTSYTVTVSEPSAIHPTHCNIERQSQKNMYLRFV